jgi:hypothetical protein
MLITPQLAEELAKEGQKLREEYRKRLKKMWDVNRDNKPL